MATIEFDFSTPVEDKREAGFRCPCCSQYVKLYTRKLNSSMAAVLIILWRTGNTRFIHVEDYLKANGYSHLRADFHKLCHWSLLEKKSGEREDGNPRNGFYKITGRGIAFANNALTVPSHVVIFNNKFQSFEGEQITIHDALREKFNYQELLTN